MKKRIEFYTDQELDSSSNLYNYDARLYDPVIGRFVSADAIVPKWNKPQSLNRYSYCGNNPLKYVDPSGHDDIYYDIWGNYLKTIISKTTNVYLSYGTQDADLNHILQNVLLGSQDDFNKYTAAVFGESSGNTKESRAIADVIENRANFTGDSTTTIIETSGIYGYNKTNLTTATNGSASNGNTNLVTARAGVIGSMVSPTDTSVGAYFWDGADIKTNSHNQWGFVYSNSSHDIYNTGDVLTTNVTEYWKDANANNLSVRGSYDHKLISTTAFGGTIFWKYDNGFKKATGNKEYP